MKIVEIYTDGACKGNPGRGGYGAILKYRNFRKELNGGCSPTTNNRMEIFAAVAALEFLTEPCEVVLHSDSSYLVDAVEKHWLRNWQRNNWIKSDKQPVLNRDLWERLLKQLAVHRVRFRWVKGHASNPDNNRCDELACSAARRSGNPPDPGFRK